MSDPTPGVPSLMERARLQRKEREQAYSEGPVPHSPYGLEQVADAATRKAFEVVGEKLKDIEWIIPFSFGDGRYLYECPSCHGLSPNKSSSTGGEIDITQLVKNTIGGRGSVGHAPDCWLNEIIQLAHKEKP